MTWMDGLSTLGGGQSAWATPLTAGLNAQGGVGQNSSSGYAYGVNVSPNGPWGSINSYDSGGQITGSSPWSNDAPGAHANPLSWGGIVYNPGQFGQQDMQNLMAQFPPGQGPQATSLYDFMGRAQNPIGGIAQPMWGNALQGGYGYGPNPWGGYGQGLSQGGLVY